MTTAMPSAAAPTSRLRDLSVGIAASVIHLLIMIPGYSEGGDFDVGPWLLTLALSLVVAVLLFGLVLPRIGATGGLIVGVVALLSVLVFWAGLTLPIAAAAALAGWRARQRGDRPGIATTAVALAAVAVVALIAIIVADYITTH